ncbi:MAG: tetratricopeptide repeat protein [Acidobacteria bacterium]|nr:MAG: tetratricopeptide repeat protein [Acidobacteriota bacterium]
MATGPMSSSELKGSARLGTYLKQLRTGYGFSLRKVEEKARLAGGEIDNSQLSRYEKGRCYPSFDKLRVLAGIFNVSIQSFSDIVDLEEYEQLRPDAESFADLMVVGNEETALGNYARAYAAFQKGVEVAEAGLEMDVAHEQVGLHSTRIARGRYGLARALLKLGKISLAESELRNILKIGDGVESEILIKTLLQLANAHAELGDRFLARLEAEKCLLVAREAGDDHSVAYSLHSLGRIAYEDNDFQGSLSYFRDSLILYDEVNDTSGSLMMKVLIGASHTALGRFKVGGKLIQEALRSARQAGLRRLCALALSKLMEAEFAQKNYQRAKAYIREVDALAGSEVEEDRYIDLLFNSAFYLWQIARGEGNPIQEKIAFGRLKYLRSSLERTTPEVERFDAHIGQRKTYENLVS